MIERLRVTSLALVDEIELEFGSGLNVLTGETGAGKSIVLGALALLGGARARPQDVREGAEEAVVEAVFDTRALPELEAELAARGIACADHELIVRRAVARSGRGRAWLGGQLVPVGLLAELFSERLEISSQHASQALLRGEAQGRLLDAFGGLEAERRAVEEGVGGLRELDAELARLRAAAEERTRREDYLGFQLRELDEAQLSPDEDERLAEEHARLVHAERLRAESGAAAALLAGDPFGGDTPGASDALSHAARSVAELAELDPALAGLAERLAAAQAEVADLAADLERYAERSEGDPERLAQVEERIRLLERLRRKYGRSAAEMLAFRDQVAQELGELGHSDERMQKLAAERAAAAARVAEAAGVLSAGRQKAARKLASAAQAGIRELALAEARFQVALESEPPPADLPCGPSGAEAAAFQFSANPGEGLQPLRRVASGGELSRVFLALKNALRRSAPGMVLVFDEVDAGIGGAVADRVGAVLASLAGEHQVLCITHLPQIAARAARHFRVEKGRAGRRTTTRVQVLDAAARVEELARMAGGESVSDATRRHARALLDAARGGSPQG